MSRVVENLDLVKQVIYTRFRNFRDKESLECVAEDALIKADKKFDQSLGTAKFRSFAFKCIFRALLTHVRAQKTYRKNTMPQVSQLEKDDDARKEKESFDPEPSLDTEDELDYLLKEVSDEIRHILLLKHGFGFTFREIMDIYPSPRTTIVEQMEKAMDLARHKYQQQK